MSNTNVNDQLWVEKYRPTTIDDVIMEDDIRTEFQSYVDAKDFPHLLFFGTSGVGKTTLAKALCEQTGKDYIFINASIDSNVDVLKDKIQHFARTVSLGSGKKVVILDEIDGVRSQGFFDGLRPVIERFSNNCVFIMTCNHVEKLPEAIRSRGVQYEFVIRDKKVYCTHLMKSLVSILKKEEIEHDPKIVASIIKQCFPDIRRMINGLYKCRNSLTDKNVLYRLEGADVKPLIDAMKEKNASSIRQIICDEYVSVDAIYTNLYKRFKDFLKPKSIPVAIMITDDFMSRHSFCIDKEIHLMAFVMSLVDNCEFL